MREKNTQPNYNQQLTLHRYTSNVHCTLYASTPHYLNTQSKPYLNQYQTRKRFTYVFLRTTTCTKKYIHYNATTRISRRLSKIRQKSKNQLRQLKICRHGFSDMLFPSMKVSSKSESSTSRQFSCEFEQNEPQPSKATTRPRPSNVRFVHSASQTRTLLLRSKHSITVSDSKKHSKNIGTHDRQNTTPPPTPKKENRSRNKN